MLNVVVAILKRGRFYLTFFHVKDQSWSFPIGKAEEGESPDHAVMRELEEEIGVVANQLKYLGSHKDQLGTFHFYDIISWEGEPRNLEPEKAQDLGWRTVRGLPGPLGLGSRYAFIQHIATATKTQRCP